MPPRFAVLLSLLACACSSSASTGSPSPTGPSAPACNDPLEVVYSSQTDPSSPAVPGGILALGGAFYFIAPGDDAAVEDVLSIAPGGQSSLVAEIVSGVSPLMTDGTNLVWVTQQSIETLAPGSTQPASIPTTIYGSAFAADDTNVYALAAGVPPTLMVQPRAGGEVQTLATIPGASLDADMYDGGDALVVIDDGGPLEDGGEGAVDVYVVAKSTGTVTSFAAPPSVFKVWPAPSSSSLYANSPAGLLERYVLGGNVAPLWPAGSPTVVTQSLAVEPNGTVIFGGPRVNGDFYDGYVLGSVPAGKQAEVGACIDRSMSLVLLGVAALGESGYALLADGGTDGPWEIAKIPQ